MMISKIFSMQHLKSKYRLTLFVVMVLWLPVAGFATAQDTIPTADFEFTPVESPAPAAKTTGTVTNSSSAQRAGTKVGKSRSKQHVQPKGKQTLGAIFIAGFLGGLAALLMPCIFPMLPLTVSYFTKKAHTRAKAVRTAVFYGVNIIAIYVVLGLVITIAFGADALNSRVVPGCIRAYTAKLLGKPNG
jgi:thiol:disulfide interchange protein